MINRFLTLLAFSLALQTALSGKEKIDPTAQRGYSSEKIDTNIVNSGSIEVIIMSTSQYHFVPLNSYFQYTLTSWQFNFPSNFLSQITIQYFLLIQSQNPNYNFIVLNSSSTNSSQTLNCYIRAINEGLTQLMDMCGFDYKPNQSGICGNQILQSSQNDFNSQTMFMNCTDTQLAYNVTISNNQNSPFNGTLLFILDNSELFDQGAHPKELINLILSYQVIATINEEDKAQLFLICSLTGVVIAIMIVFATILNCKIRSIDKQLQEQKQEKID